MPPTEDPIDHLKSLPDRAARYEWLDSLDRTERNGILNRLTEDDRRRYRQHADARLAREKRSLKSADREARRQDAIAGRATDIPEMIEALYTVMPRLTESQRAWVERIDQSADASKRDGFTSRQAEVIRDLYRKQFRKRG
ncbi:MAG: hypothetical protein CMJ53_07370 [Planctomycetaceae bacterium]|nr:hypothetical protein [Planctomycetaceae bacterium]MDG1360520.1 hypothetical protein [Phycisphaerales bacterium]MDG1978444.1 hypothetical protein [Phycisphaerales bacterium]MDG2132334.1 hypothetical protein [Phycisphaerales bacterium]